MDSTIITRSDVIRGLAKLYSNPYGARLLSFLELLVTKAASSGKIENAAGIRLRFQELFSGYYLDRPVGWPPSVGFERVIECDPIVEVCNLAAAEFGHSRPFTRTLIEFMEFAGAERVISLPAGR
jgi:Thermostable hemolysin